MDKQKYHYCLARGNPAPRALGGQIYTSWHPVLKARCEVYRYSKRDPWRARLADWPYDGDETKHMTGAAGVTRDEAMDALTRVYKNTTGGRDE